MKTMTAEDLYRIRQTAFRTVRDPSTGEAKTEVTISNEDLNWLLNSLEMVLREGFYR